MATILSVDDSASLRQMLFITLQNAGYQVTSAEDGHQALELARQFNFDLVLTDFNMPLLNGLGLVKALRQLPSYRFTPILLLTTDDSAEKKQAGREAGATGWLKKPIDPKILVQTIAMVLN